MQIIKLQPYTILKRIQYLQGIGYEMLQSIHIAFNENKLQMKPITKNPNHLFVNCHNMPFYEVLTINEIVKELGLDINVVAFTEEIELEQKEMTPIAYLHIH